MTAPASQLDPTPQYTRCWLSAPYRHALAYRTQGSGRPVVLLPNVRHQVPRQAPAILHTMLDDFLARWDALEQQAASAD